MAMSCELNRIQLADFLENLLSGQLASSGETIHLTRWMPQAVVGLNALRVREGFSV